MLASAFQADTFEEQALGLVNEMTSFGLSQFRLAEPNLLKHILMVVSVLLPLGGGLTRWRLLPGIDASMATIRPGHILGGSIMSAFHSF